MQKLMQKYLKKFEEILFWLLITLLAFVILYQKFPFIEIPKMVVSIRLEDFLILFTVLFWAFYIFVAGKIKDLFKSRIFQAAVIFWFIGFVSSYSAVNLIQTVSFTSVFFHFLRRVELLILIFLGMTIPFDKRRFKIFLLTLASSLFLVNFYGVGQLYFRFPSISTINTELSKGKIVYLVAGQRINSTFAGHYDLALFLVMAMILILSFIVYLWPQVIKRKKSKIYLFVVLAFLFAFSFYVFMLTAARLSFIALVLGIIFLLFILGKKKLIFVSGIVFLAVLLYPSDLRDRFLLTIKVNLNREWNSFTAINSEQEERSRLNIPTLPSSGKRIDVGEGLPADVVPGEPVNSAEVAVYRSFEIRTKVEWPRAWRAFLRNPLLGSGYSSVDLATDNDFLRLLAEVGILGFVAFSLLLFAIFKELFYFWKKSSGFVKYYVSGVIALFFAFIVNSLLIDVFEASKIASLLWLLLGVTFSYLYNNKRGKDYAK
jgi:hypothetical protein